jgi:hypothetical protein
MTPPSCPGLITVLAPRLRGGQGESPKGVDRPIAYASRLGRIKSLFGRSGNLPRGSAKINHLTV